MEKFEKGQKAKIKFNISRDKIYEIACPVKWVEKDRISLVFPREEQILSKYLYEGRLLEVIIYTNEGIFVFDSIVIDSPFNIDFVVELPEENSKIQRRAYIRASLELDFFLSEENFKFKTKTVNISGGGIRFIIDRELELNKLFNFALYLPKNDSIVKGTGTILYSLKQNNSMISVIKFIEIGESDQNKIIKLCFEKEVEQLKIKADKKEN